MSNLPVYPPNGVYADQQLMSLLGSYWVNYFADRTVLAGIMKDRAALAGQTVIDLGETHQLVSRFDCPVYHNETWVPMYVLRSSTLDSSIAPLNYGADKALYGAEGNPPYAQVFTYKSSLIDGSNGAYPVDPRYKRIRMLVNRLTDPSLVLVNNVDFRIDAEDGLLALPINLFTDERIATRSVYSEGGLADTEALLWAFSCDIDVQYLWEHFGFVYGVQRESGQPYKDLLNATYDSHIGAPSHDTLVRTLSAAMDIPVAVGDETVVDILYGRKLQVVTDKRVYTFNVDSDLLVVVGDTLVDGQQLVDTVQVLDLNKVDDGMTTTVQTTVKQQLTLTPVQPVKTIPQVPYSVAEYRGPEGISLDRVWGAGAREIILSVGWAGFDHYNGVKGLDPNAKQYLGPFRNENVVFQSSALPEHDTVAISFDLIIVGRWQGNDSTAKWGLYVDSQKVVETNFSNTAANKQAYPAEVGEGAYARYTGAVEPKNDGTMFGTYWSAYAVKDSFTRSVVHPGSGEMLQPSKYHFDFKLAHTSPNINVTFSVNGLPIDVEYMVVNTVPSQVSLGCILDPWYPADKIIPPYEPSFVGDPAKLTYDSANQLTYKMTSDLSGEWKVTATNPDGQTSGAATFTLIPVTDTPPTITSISDVPITINGHNFQQGVTVTMRDMTSGVVTDIPANQLTRVSADQLIAGAVVANGQYTFTVSNPGGQSASMVRLVGPTTQATGPTITSTSPATVPALNVETTLEITSTEFNTTTPIVIGSHQEWRAPTLNYSLDLNVLFSYLNYTPPAYYYAYGDMLRKALNSLQYAAGGGRTDVQSVLAAANYIARAENGGQAGRRQWIADRTALYDHWVAIGAWTAATYAKAMLIVNNYVPSAARYMTVINDICLQSPYTANDATVLVAALYEPLDLGWWITVQDWGTTTTQDDVSFFLTTPAGATIPYTLVSATANTRTITFTPGGNVGTWAIQAFKSFSNPGAAYPLSVTADAGSPPSITSVSVSGTANPYTLTLNGYDFVDGVTLTFTTPTWGGPGYMLPDLVASARPKPRMPWINRTATTPPRESVIIPAYAYDSTPSIDGDWYASTVESWCVLYSVKQYVMNVDVNSPAYVYPAEFWALDNLEVSVQTTTKSSLRNIPESLLANPDVPGVALDSHFMAGVYFSSIFFPNKDVDVVYEGVDDQGFAKVSFEVGGFPADVEQFWTDVHSRGIALGRTLAQYLDRRPHAITTPQAKDMPKTINPMLFIMRHVMKYNTIVIKLRRGLSGPGALPADVLNGLHWTLPPHIAYIIYTETVAGVDIMTDPVLTETSAADCRVVSEDTTVTIMTPPPSVHMIDGVLV